MFQIKADKLPIPEREYRFAAMAVGGTGRGVRERLRKAGLRDWRFDFAYLEKKIAIEVEGGTFSGGRHTRGAGFEMDCRKYNEAMLLGWHIIRVTGRHIAEGDASIWIKKALDADAFERWAHPFQPDFLEGGSDES